MTRAPSTVAAEVHGSVLKSHRIPVRGDGNLQKSEGAAG
jgi:hypothetical protein